MTIALAPESLRPTSLLIGSSSAIQRAREMIDLVADTLAPVLVTGPTGSGKELVARELHLRARRAREPFVPINCGAIPRELIESELFGHERGAFTGAHAARAGRFEQVRAGTLFLDEIGEMPADMQVRLLRVLESRQFERVGGGTPIDLRARIVSATHRNLEEAIEQRGFRSDLHYRLNVILIDIPPLKNRREDIAPILDHFTEIYGGDDRVTFDTAAMQLLGEHGWPGNVRELRNFVERASILHRGRHLNASHVATLLHAAPAERVEAYAQLLAHSRPALPVEPLAGVDTIDPSDLRMALATIERRFIRAALDASNGIVADAARRLKLSRTTLIERMRRLDIVARPPNGAGDPDADAAPSADRSPPSFHAVH